MKRRYRLFFNGLTFISAILLIAIVPLWVRSYWVGHGLYWNRQHDDGDINSERGEIVIDWRYGLDDAFVTPSSYYTFSNDSYEIDVNSFNTHRSLAGFKFGSSYDKSGFGMFRWVIPYWFLALSFMILPLRWRLRGKRVAPGMCVKCGYDLRATPDRCPECGTISRQNEFTSNKSAPLITTAAPIRK